MAGERQELGKAGQDLAHARQQFVTSAKQRLASIDTKLSELAMKTDAASKAAAVRLKGQRDALAMKIDAIGRETDTTWMDAKSKINDEFDSLEKSVRDAID